METNVIGLSECLSEHLSALMEWRNCAKQRNIDGQMCFGYY